MIEDRALVAIMAAILYAPLADSDGISSDIARELAVKDAMELLKIVELGPQ